MASDLIDRKEFIKRFCGEQCGCKREECGYEYVEDGHDACFIVEEIEKEPTVDAEPIRHAEWIPWVINGKETKLFMTCSGCRRYQWPRSEVPLFRRCPKCGAIMDGGAK